MGLTSSQKKAVIVLIAGAVLVVLNQTLLSPALPVIMSDMNVDATTVQWLTSGYSLVEAIIIPLSAYLMGRFGSRKLFIGGLCIFGAGTLLAAFAPAFIVLLLGRMLQASATGFVMPLVFTSILIIFPRERRGSAMGIVSLVIGFAPAVGPSASGALVEAVGWRALFLIVAALTLIIVIAAFFSLPNKGDFEKSTFDKPSVALSSFGLLTLLLGLSSITSSENVALDILFIVVGIILLSFFVHRQFKLPTPFLKIQVLKSRNYRIDVIIVACFQIGLVGIGVLMPIYLQNLMGYTPLQTGLIMLPGAIIGALTALCAGRLFDKFGVRKLAVPGTFVALLGGAGLLLLGLDTTTILIICIYSLLPLGIEFTMTPLNTWGINSLDNRVIQHASATSNTINQVAASLGTAILVSLSATSTFIYPELSPIPQQMAGIHISFCFTALMLLTIFIVVVVFVRDKKNEPSEVTDHVMETMPIEAPQNSRSVLVSHVMNKDPYFVTADNDIHDAARLMAQNKTSGLPVIDNDQKVIAFISDGDILDYIGRKDTTIVDASMMLYQIEDNEGFAARISDLIGKNVMEVATKKVVSVDARTPLDEACRLLFDMRLKKVPVLENERLIGTLSRWDIVEMMMENISMIEQDAAKEKDTYSEIVE